MAKPSKEQRLEALALFSAVNSGVRVAQKLNITYELIKDWLLRFKFDHTDWREDIICQNNFRHSFSLTWSGKTCDIRRSL